MEEGKQQSMILSFCTITGASEIEAANILAKHNWELDAAVNHYFDELSHVTAQRSQVMSQSQLLGLSINQQKNIQSQTPPSSSCLHQSSPTIKKQRSFSQTSDPRSRFALPNFSRVQPYLTSYDPNNNSNNSNNSSSNKYDAVTATTNIYNNRNSNGNISDLESPRRLSGNVGVLPVALISAPFSMVPRADLPQMTPCRPHFGMSIPQNISKALAHSSISSSTSGNNSVNAVITYPVPPTARQLAATNSERAQSYPYNNLASRSIITQCDLTNIPVDSATVLISSRDGEVFTLRMFHGPTALTEPCSFHYSQLRSQRDVLLFKTVNLAGLTFNLKGLLTLLERKFIPKFSPLATNGFSSFMPLASAVPAAPNRVDLLRGLMGWQLLSHSAIMEADGQNLLDCLPLICSALAHTPMILQSQTNQIITAIEKRASADQHISQCVDSVAAALCDARNILRNAPRHSHSRSFFATVSRHIWGSSKDDQAVFFTCDSTTTTTNNSNSHNNNQSLPYTMHVSRDSTVFHPFMYGVQISSVTVERVFKSNARPALLLLHAATPGIAPTRVVLKKGCDFRQEVAALALFAVMNNIWSSEDVRHDSIPVFAPTFRCVAIDDQLGCCEFVNNCATLKDFDFSVVESRPDLVSRMAATAAGSFMGAWVLGVRDRHNENILATNDGEIFHIDFGYILGNKVRMDTGPFAITPPLQRALGVQWDSFVATSLRAFSVLQKHHDVITRVGVDLLAYFINEPKVKTHLRESLFLNEESQKAHATLMRLLQQAPQSMRTRAKNTIHTLAQKIK